VTSSLGLTYYFSSVGYVQAKSGLPAKLETDVYQTKSPVSATVRCDQPIAARPGRTSPASYQLTVRCAWSSRTEQA